MATNKELAKIVERIKGGDGAAFGELYEATNKAVFYHASTILKSTEDVEDAVQEAYEQAYLNLHKLKSREAVASWLNQIVSYISLNKLRAQKGKTVYSIDDEDFFEEPAADREQMPDEIAEKEDTRAYIGGMIDRLPEQQKLAVMLYYYDDLSVKEIASEKVLGKHGQKQAQLCPQDAQGRAGAGREAERYPLLHDHAAVAAQRCGLAHRAHRPIGAQHHRRREQSVPARRNGADSRRGGAGRDRCLHRRTDGGGSRNAHARRAVYHHLPQADHRRAAGLTRDRNGRRHGNAASRPAAGADRDHRSLASPLTGGDG